MVKNLPAKARNLRDVVRSLGQEDPLDENTASDSSILAWRIPMDRGAWQATVRGVAKRRRRWLWAQGGPRYPQESFPEEPLEAASPVRRGSASCCSCLFVVVVENEGLAVPLNSPQLSVHLASLQGWLSSPTSGPVPELSSTGEAWKFPLLPSL